MQTESYRDTRGPGQSGFVALLEEAGKRKDGQAKRDRAILRLLHDLALRRGEVTKLDLGDVNLQDRTISVLGKGRIQKETLALPDPTKAALVEWLEERGTDRLTSTL